MLQSCPRFVSLDVHEVEIWVESAFLLCRYSLHNGLLGFERVEKY